jgi:hypothetical protein
MADKLHEAIVRAAMERAAKELDDEDRFTEADIVRDLASDPAAVAQIIEQAQED